MIYRLLNVQNRCKSIELYKSICLRIFQIVISYIKSTIKGRKLKTI